MVPDARALKAAVAIPVIASGRIEPAAADRHIRAGHFDFLAMGRKILADPDLPNKLQAGRPETIRPCVYCYCCASQIYKVQAVKCAVNPETAYERERALIATDSPRHIGVIGGGPAGMEVARRLALRGFRVSLFEAGPRLGGTLQFASIAYQPNESLLHWLRREIRTSAVSVHLDTIATPDLLRRLAVEEVVVATGARRDMPSIPGSDQDFVFSGDEMRALVMGDPLPSLARKLPAAARAAVKAAAVLGLTANPSLVRMGSRLWMPVPERIVIIGGELVGLELAEFLAQRGRVVTVLATSASVGEGLYVVRRLRLLEELQHLGVALVREAGSIAIRPGGHVAYSNYRGQQRTVDADQVIVATGARGDSTTAQAFRESGLPVHTIGDCNGVGYIEGAMEAAAELAARL
jgi:NADPH-dependent 2,4-dienoyl-CoA reductase/sulfur reductase-like enzyme